MTPNEAASVAVAIPVYIEPITEEISNIIMKYVRHTKSNILKTGEGNET